MTNSYPAPLPYRPESSKQPSVNLISAVKAIMAGLFVAFAVCWHPIALDSANESIGGLIYQGIRDQGFIMAIVFTLTSAWVLTSPVKADTFTKRISADILAILFAFAMVIGRAFSIEDAGIGTYGSTLVLTETPLRLLLTCIGIIGWFILSRKSILLAFSRFDYTILKYTDKQSTKNRVKPLTGFASKNIANDQQIPTWQTLINGLLDRIQVSTIPCMVILIICWLPCIILWFPGCLHHDAANQLLQFFGVVPWSGHHPIISTLIYGSLVQVGKWLGSDALGVFFVMTLQTLLLSYALSRVVQCTIRIRPQSTWLTLGTLVIFALVPLWSNCAATIKKDSLSCAVFALLMVICIEYLHAVEKAQHDKKINKHPILTKAIHAKVFISFFILATLLALLRNEGILLSASVAICTTIYLLVLKAGNKAPSTIILCLIGVLLIWGVGYRGALMTALDAQSGSIGEALSLPIQQTARYYIEAPDDVTESISAGVSRVLDEAGLTAETYDPEISDNLKFNYFNADVTLDDLLVFAEAYVEMGIAHPEIFTSAFVDQTMGWWYLELFGDPDHAVGDMGLYQNFPQKDLYSQALDVSMPFWESGITQTLITLQDLFAYIPFVGLLVYPPIYLWTTLLLCFYTLACNPRKILILLPLLLIFCICLASPVSGLSRYALPAMASLPCVWAFVLSRISPPDQLYASKASSGISHSE